MMEENILKCIVFDQDCFRDIRILAADQRQRKWDVDYLPELTIVSRAEKLYTRHDVPHTVNRYMNISDEDQVILRSLWITNVILLGSQQDGLYLEKPFAIFGSKEYSDVYETDLDCLFVYSGVDIKQVHPVSSPEEKYLFAEETDHSGYFRLRLCLPNHDKGKALAYFNAKTLKRQLYIDLQTANFYVNQNPYEVITDNPAIGGAIEDELGTHFLDYVVAIKMNEWPKVATEFINRDRESGWPSPELVKKIVSSGCGFVATGYHQPIRDNFQWRLSFSAAERILVRSLSDAQVRAYMFLKALFRMHLSEPECLSTYMMKNILFWTLEAIPLDTWYEDNILYCVESMVDMLVAFLDQNILPSFFLPSLNLIGHIEEATIKEITKKVHEIQDNVMKYVIICAESTDFQGIVQVSLNLLHVTMVTMSENETNSTLSMVYFTIYLYLRLQSRRYWYKLNRKTVDECLEKRCGSLCHVIPRRAAWYLRLSLQFQPDLSSFQLKKNENIWLMDLQGLREKVVSFCKSNLYKGLLKKVIGDQEFITNETIKVIPEYDDFLDWVDRTCIWGEGIGLKEGNMNFMINLD